MKIQDRRISPWSNHLRIAIRSWSLSRAREVSDAARKAPDLECFLAELLTDALLTFNDDYEKCYTDHIHQLERLLHDALVIKLSPPIMSRSEGRKS